MSDNSLITNVEIQLASQWELENSKVRGYASVTICNLFVIKELRIIEGRNGLPFVCMPSRKKMFHCKHCRTKNVFNAKFCNCCGKLIDPQPPLELDEFGRSAGYADIAHPICPKARELLHDAVMEAFNSELEAKQRVLEHFGVGVA